MATFSGKQILNQKNMTFYINFKEMKLRLKNCAEKNY